MLGGLGYDYHTIAYAISQIVGTSLRRHAARDIVNVGVGVEQVIEEIRRDHPADVPTHPMVPGRGLLARSETPFGDFELAQHLVSTRHRVMVKLERLFPDIPPLMAYLAVVCLSTETNQHVGMDELRYAVQESGFRQRLTEKELMKWKISVDGLREGGRKGGKESGKARARVPDAETLRAVQKQMITSKFCTERGSAGALGNKYKVTAGHIRKLLKRA